MEKYQNKYRIPSARAPFWDYGWNAAYFITICTQNRIHWFGHVENGKMILSEIGQIVKTEWLKTFEMRPDMNLFMGEYIIMPNHFHAIIGIGENQYNSQRRDAMHCVSTTDTTDTNDTNHTNHITNPTEPKNKFGPQSKNLASIIRGFKIGVTQNARILQPDFAWQPRYHDHVIRNEQSYQSISNYILNNPAKWSDDKFFTV